MGAYTPEPWERQGELVFHKDLKGGLVAQIYDRASINRVFADHAKNVTVAEADANGDLIAAAPDLLKELERNVGVFRWAAGNYPEQAEFWEKAARASMEVSNKARGVEKVLPRHIPHKKGKPRLSR
jgi:hypothetical protein